MLTTGATGALDAGAHGLVVPLLNSAEEARKLVAAAKFPPAGIRGYGSPFVTGPFGLESTTQYLQQANESLLTIVQIETKAALDDVCPLLGRLFGLIH